MSHTPQFVTQALKTRSGTAFEVRRTAPEDEALLESFFEKVSDEDRRFRFLNAQKHVGHEQLRPIVEVDHFRSESYLVLDPATGEIVASGMLACDKPLEVAEVAVSIRSDYRNHGIGWAMLDLLAKEAEHRGVREIIAIEDRHNHAAIDLEREKGFMPHGYEGDPHLVVLHKSLVAA